MIPEKTPALAAIAWITVVLAYAWVSNRDHDDAVLARRAGGEVREAGSGKKPPLAPHPSHPAPRTPIPLTTGVKP